MSASVQYAHELLDRMTEEQVRALVKRMERIVWRGEGHAAADLAEIRRLAGPVAERYGVERVWLFGSRARGDNRPDSDYDFLISPGAVHSLWQYADFVEDLERALKSHVDVVSDDTQDQELVREARREAVLVYEQAGRGDSPQNSGVL